VDPLIWRPKPVRLNTPLGSTAVSAPALDVTGVVLDQTGGGAAGVTLSKSSLARRTGGVTQAKSAAMRGISENAFSVVVRNAQNSAPSKNDILNGRDRRRFFLVIIFIADVLCGFVSNLFLRTSLCFCRWDLSRYGSHKESMTLVTQHLS
jgi:hypothetical protein